MDQNVLVHNNKHNLKWCEDMILKHKGFGNNISKCTEPCKPEYRMMDYEDCKVNDWYINVCKQKGNSQSFCRKELDARCKRLLVVIDEDTVP